MDPIALIRCILTAGICVLGTTVSPAADARAEEEANSTAVETLRNGDFLSGTSNWKISGTVEDSVDETVKAALDPDQPYRDHPSLCLTASPGKGGVSIYQTPSVEGGRLYEIKAAYRAPHPGSTTDGPLRLKFAFIKEGGDNGSAGVVRMNLPPANGTEWNEFRHYVFVPGEAKMCQLVISLRHGQRKAWIGEVSFKEEHPFDIKATKEPLPVESSQSEETWRSLPGIRGFWQVGNPSVPASLATEVKLTYDQENLYVQMTNTEPESAEIQKKSVNRDDRLVYSDDCNEIFIAVPGGAVRQFITSAGGTQWDAALFQKADGDPYRPDVTWNGKWTSRAVIEDSRWITRWSIPWSDLDVKPQPGTVLKLNFARERKAGTKELSQWSYFDGKFNTVEKFATLTFEDSEANLVRFVEPIVDHPLRIERPKKVYRELLGELPGNYLVGDWSHAFHLTSYPSAFQQQYEPDSWRQEQIRILDELGSHGMFGPAMPWVWKVGWNQLEKANRQWGMKFPYFMDSSAINRAARKNGARLFDPRTGAVSDFDPAKIEAFRSSLTGFFDRHPQSKSLALVMNGTDEPSNSMQTAFSRTRRPEAGAILDEVDKEIRATTAAGQFGLYDYFNSADASSPDAPFRRIAFNRWWNRKMAGASSELRKLTRELVSDVPFCAFTHNSVSGMSQADITLLSRDSDWVSADPYPTATLTWYGRARALYHTGFTTKFMFDLSGGKTTQIIPQGFKYHGRFPTREDVREWASQALKNGGKVLFWYTSGPSRLDLPEVYEEMLAINRQVHDMKELLLPGSTRTAILFSISSQAAFNDPVLHGSYTLYTLLGERSGTWFKFVSETQVAENPASLDEFDLIYIPQASYIAEPVAQTILARVMNGATVVVLDPRAFQHADDGGNLSAIRTALIGGELKERRTAGSMTTEAGTLPGVEGGLHLPVTPIANREESGKVLAFNIVPPGDASLLATYGDGKAAAYARRVGKGQVLYFAAQPFGNSSLAMADSAWIGLFKTIAHNVGEPTGLPIWNFYLEPEKL